MRIRAFQRRAGPHALRRLPGLRSVACATLRERSAPLRFRTQSRDWDKPLRPTQGWHSREPPRFHPKDGSAGAAQLAFAAGIGAATTILFGSVPAFKAMGVAPIASLNYQARNGAPRPRRHLSSALLIAQVALSLVIITVAGLLVHSFENLATLPLGFDRDRVLLVNVDLAPTQVGANGRVPFVEQLVRRVAAVPGVQGAAASMVPPVAGFGLIDVVRVPGVPVSGQAMVDGKLGPDRTFLNFITPGWFSAHGTPIRAGRDFDERDGPGAAPVIVVNEAFVRKFVSAEQPIGTSVTFEQRNGPLTKTIVGVIGSAAYLSLRNADAPIEFAPLSQHDATATMPTEFTISVRAASGAPALLARRIRRRLPPASPISSSVFARWLIK